MLTKASIKLRFMLAGRFFIADLECISRSFKNEATLGSIVVTVRIRDSLSSNSHVCNSTDSSPDHLSK